MEENKKEAEAMEEEKKEEGLKTEKDIIEALNKKISDYEAKLEKSIEQNKRLYELLKNGNEKKEKMEKITNGDIDEKEELEKKEKQKKLYDKILKDIKERVNLNG